MINGFCKKGDANYRHLGKRSAPEAQPEFKSPATQGYFCPRPVKFVAENL